MNLEQNKVYIKTSNYWAIHDFALFGNRSRIYGTKLKALYHLVQAKGEALDWGSSHKYKGVKVLDYGNGESIGFIRTGFKSNSFYPCKLYLLCLQALGGGVK